MPRKLLRAQFCACVLLLPSACAMDARTPAPEPDALPTAAWTLSPEPVLEIGVREGPAELRFTTIASAFRAPDGRIVVANGASPAEIRIFSPTGAHLRTYGRHGDGPGEYQGIAWVRPMTMDTIVAYDPWLQRVSYLSLGGGFARAESTALPGTGELSSVLYLIAPSREGTFLARSNWVIEPGTTGSGRASTPLLRVRLAPPAVDTLIVFGGAQYVTDRGQGTIPLFGARSAVAYRAGRIFIGHGDEFRIDEYTLEGVHIRTFERPYEARPVTDEVVEAARLAAVTSADEDDRTRVEARYREAPRAEQLPAHTTNILVDDTGHLWVEEYTTPGEPHAWSVFDPVGVFLGSVHVPADLRLTHVGRDAVFGVHRDEFGLETVRVYDLHR